jgi:Putative translation initiation inhibitor, yjgF family
MAMKPTERLRELGLVLPPPRKPVGNFVPAVRSGNLLFLSGQGPVLPDGTAFTGKVGQDFSVDEAYEHAKICTLNLLALAHDALGSIDSIERIVKVLGFVNGVPDFGDQPRVINGCSDLLIAIFGPERGAHARSAVGAGSLPRQISVEVEMVVEVS